MWVKTSKTTYERVRGKRAIVKRQRDGTWTWVYKTDAGEFHGMESSSEMAIDAVEDSLAGLSTPGRFIEIREAGYLRSIALKNF